jgi:uncharacterized protein (UPF0333 family)
MAPQDTKGGLEGRASAQTPSASYGLLRGQAATEYLILAGFAIAFIVPLAFLFMSASNSELGKAGVSQAKIAVTAIADEAGEIYLQGNGSKKTILVNYPEGIKDGAVEGGLVVLTIDADSRTQDIASSTFANITGNLSGKRKAGLQRISLVNKGDYVDIKYG